MIKHITKSVTFTNIDLIIDLLDKNNTLRLEATTLGDLQLISERIFAKDDLEIIGKIKLSWSWKHLKRVWCVKVKKVNITDL